MPVSIPHGVAAATFNNLLLDAPVESTKLKYAGCRHYLRRQSGKRRLARKKCARSEGVLHTTQFQLKVTPGNGPGFSYNETRGILIAKVTPYPAHELAIRG